MRGGGVPLSALDFQKISTILKKTEGRVTSPNNEDFLCKFVC